MLAQAVYNGSKFITSLQLTPDNSNPHQLKHRVNSNQN